jgi:hypothetical protein
MLRAQTSTHAHTHKNNIQTLLCTIQIPKNGLLFKLNIQQKSNTFLILYFALEDGQQIRSMLCFIFIWQTDWFNGTCNAITTYATAKISYLGDGTESYIQKTIESIQKFYFGVFTFKLLYITWKIIHRLPIFIKFGMYKSVQHLNVQHQITSTYYKHIIKSRNTTCNCLFFHTIAISIRTFIPLFYKIKHFSMAVFISKGCEVLKLYTT